MKKHFIEKQRFTQWWIWLILIGVVSIPIWGIVQQVFMGEPFGDNPMSDTGLYIFAICTLGFLFFFRYMSLITEVGEEGIKMRFVPFVEKSLRWDELKSARIVNYGFIGYGIRVGSIHGTVYNMNGQKGLALLLHNGVKFVIGTEREDELIAVVNEYLKDKED